MLRAVAARGSAREQNREQDKVGRFFGLTLGLLLLLVSCAARPSTQAAGARRTTLRYQVELAPTLDAIDVTVCFHGFMFGGLVPGKAEAASRLRRAVWQGRGPEQRPLALAAGRIPIAREQREGCLRYAVDLHEGGSLGALVTRVNEHLVASPNVWLWRPALRSRLLEATLSLTLPAGIRASLPFVRVQGAANEYELPDSVFAFDSHAAFGPFEELHVEEAGVHAHGAILGSLRGLEPPAGARAWLRDAVRIASSSDGRFPARALHVLVIPGGDGYEPFGSVARGGGASVLLFVPEHFDAERLARDWVLPHELSHLLLPFVRREDAWLAEGLATYYQEVSRARAGVITPVEALANIAQALRSAQREGTGRTLCEESRTMHQTHAYRAVYWGGAGALLLADVALRRESRGRVTLDGLLTRVRREARMTPAYSARELLQRLDTLAESRVFRALGERCEQAAFPEFEPTLRELGVDAQGHVQEHAPLAWLRAQLFAPQP